MKANMPLITMWIVCGIVTTIGMIITKDFFLMLIIIALICITFKD